MKKPDLHIVSFSGGKDSSALVLHMIELGMHIDEVICVDTFKEFPAMYGHIEKMRKIIEDAGIKFTMLKSERTFDEWFFDYVPNRKDKRKQHLKGKSWASPLQRWCTADLKRDVINKYLKKKGSDHNIIQYVGIAFDEIHRTERKLAQLEVKKYPLVDWGWTEKDCLEYCYDKGFDWEGLYEHFSRVSCWCCTLQSLEELRKLRRYYPELW